VLADAELDAVVAFGPDHDDLDLGPERRMPSFLLGAAAALVVAGGAALVLVAGIGGGEPTVSLAPAADVHPVSALSASVTVAGESPVHATVRLADAAAVPTMECLRLDWGDGTVVEHPSCAPPACDAAAAAPGGGWLDVGFDHAYAGAGTYVVAVAARGCDGTPATASATVTVP
jgi:hypothetical protein